jgi:hypothetical protein
MLLSLLLSAVLSVAPAMAADQPPSTDVLMKKFIERSQEEEKQNLGKNYGFIEHSIHDELDKNGKVKTHKDQTFQLIVQEGHRVRRLIAKDGKPLAVDEQSKEAEREKKAEEQRKKAAEKKKKSGDDSDVKLDEQFLSHFKFEIVGREEINGRPSYVVTVLPQASVHPLRSNAEKMFTHMEGKVWVDADEYSLAKCDLHLTEPTSFYGILGSIRQLDLLMQRRHVDDKVWMPEKLTFAIDGRRLMTSFRMKQASDYSDFRLLADKNR